MQSRLDPAWAVSAFFEDATCDADLEPSNKLRFVAHLVATDLVYIHVFSVLREFNGGSLSLVLPSVALSSDYWFA